MKNHIKTLNFAFSMTLFTSKLSVPQIHAEKLKIFQEVIGKWVLIKC